MTSKNNEFEFSSPEEKSEYMRTAPITKLYQLWEYDKKKAQEGKEEQYIQCPKCLQRPQAVFVDASNLPSCHVCSTELVIVNFKQEESVWDKFYVSVPKAYDKQGNPIKGGMTVRVPRRSVDNW